MSIRNSVNDSVSNSVSNGKGKFISLQYIESALCQVISVFHIYLRLVKRLIVVAYNYYLNCIKHVRIRKYSGPHFSAFRLNTERYRISVRIQSVCGKMRTRIFPNTSTFHGVLLGYFNGTNIFVL